MAIDALSNVGNPYQVQGKANGAERVRAHDGQGPQRFRGADANGDRKLSWQEALDGYLHTQGEKGKELFFKYAGDDQELDRPEARLVRQYVRWERQQEQG